MNEWREQFVKKHAAVRVQNQWKQLRRSLPGTTENNTKTGTAKQSSFVFATKNPKLFK